MNKLEMIKVIESRTDLTSDEFFNYSVMAATIDFINQIGGIEKCQKIMDDFIIESMAMPSYKKYLKQKAA